MLTEAHYEAALNYFYFLLLDEGATLHCALRTVRRLKKKSNTLDSDQKNIELIEELSREFKRYRSKKRLAPSVPPRSEWRMAHHEGLAHWKEYLRHSDPQFAEALVLRFILNYSVATIAKALGEPVGTIYFRIGRGLEAVSGGSL